MKYSLDISNFLEEISIVFPILLFSSIPLHWSLRKAFLSLLAILWNSAFRCLYLSFSHLLLASLLFTAICKASSDSHFALLHYFFLAMVLILGDTGLQTPNQNLLCRLPEPHHQSILNNFTEPRVAPLSPRGAALALEIGRASCRERV